LKLEPDLDPELEKICEHGAWILYWMHCTILSGSRIIDNTATNSKS